MHEVTAKAAFTEVYLDGKVSAPRGKPVKEVLYYRQEIQYPFHNFDFRVRDNLAYIKIEFLWYLRGDPFDDSICKHAAIWKTIKQPNGRIFSNYGYYWFNRLNKDRHSGFGHAANLLLADPDTRQAYIPMLGNEHMFTGNMDVVCTKGIAFRIVNGKLDMHAAMRSSDLAIGSSIDWPTFSFLHEMMAVQLNIERGRFIFSTDSLHVYEKDWEYMENVVNCDPYTSVRKYIIPPITSVEDLLDGTFKSPFGKWLLS